MECKAKSNKAKCPCPSDDCKRKGICCDCLRYHLADQSLPMCMRDLDWVNETM